MAEQVSRRSNNVTSAGFEQPFENHLIRYGGKGLNLANALDAMEGWSRLTNIWHQNEGEATARPGQTEFATVGTGETVHSIRKLRTPASPPATRFWGADTSLYRAELGAAASVATGFSGDPLALLPHRPTLSGNPWMFVADRTKPMIKVRDDSLVCPVGLGIPSGPPTLTLGQEHRCWIAEFESADGTQASAWTGNPGTDTDGNASGTPITEDSAGVPPDSTSTSLVRFRTTVGSAIKTYDNWWNHAFTRNLAELSPFPGGGTNIAASDDDLIHFWLFFSLPHLIEEMRIYFVCSETFSTSVLPGTVGAEAGNEDAYFKSFRPHDFASSIQGRLSQIEAAEIARVRSLRDQNLIDRRIGDVRDTWAELRAVKDPARALSLAAAGGSYQWFEFGTVGVPLRRGDFQRLGVTEGRDWSTITGIVIYVRMGIDAINTTGVIGLDDLYMTGGFGPDTAEPGAQQYDYKITNYDPRTGAESNGQDVESTKLDSLRRHIVVDPPAYGDSAVRQRIYRRGGAIIDDWYFVAENSGDGAAFTDTLSDAAILTAGTIPTDHFQPVPTIHRTTGATVLNQAVPALWGPIQGMLFACGDPHRPGHVYFSLPDAPDHWSSSGNTEVCAPSEELMNGGVAGHQGFVFSRTRLYFLYPNLTGEVGVVTATPGLCTRGLLGRWAFCTGPGGTIFFVAEDGVFATDGGPEKWISEAINPLFYGTAVNGYSPIDKTKTTAIRLTIWENDLYFLYEDTGGNRQVLVYSILQQFWRAYSFGQSPACIQGEDEEVLLIGGEDTGAAYRHEGTSDAGLPIACTIRTGSMSGQRREEKLFGDLFADVDTQGVDLDLQVFLNEETHANTAIVLSNSAGRRRFLVDAFGPAPQKAHSIASEIRWTTTGTPPILYQFGFAVTLQPDLTTVRVTNWDDLNSPDEVWLTGVTLDCDTGGAVKTINVERDFNGERILVASFTVQSNNRHKFKFSWLAVPAHQVRIRPDPECVPWLLYRADWIYVEEPPRISKWDIHFENRWDQYYTGLDLYCDTFGQEKRIEIWVDEVQLVNTLAGGLTYWPIQTDGRRVVHLTLPWGRGHVFRFFAIDEYPGLLYTHRWHLQEEPSEQANWNQNFSILGTHADKWLKAIIFECDTFGQNKSVEIEVDGATVETLTVNTNGRRVVQLALPAQHLGRVWRMFPVDANPGRLYSAEPIFDEEPFQLDRWETQELNHGLPGWFYPLYAHITIKSTADVTLTTVMQHNQTGGTTTRTYTIPSTGGVKQRRFLNGFHAGKGVLIKYTLTSAAPFWLYRDETSVVIQPWGAYDPIVVKPFGNDDQDPSRTMTHAILAAQTAGGAAGTNPGVGG